MTHSLAFGVVAALLVLAVTKSRGWALGIMIGQWSHVLTDTFDSVGTMIFFPFSAQHYSVNAWASPPSKAATATLPLTTRASGWYGMCSGSAWP